MKTVLLLNLIILSAVCVAFAGEMDTHPQICEDIKTQLSEDCSEESDTFNRETGELIKRTYEECYVQDLDSTLKRLNEFMTDELGIYVYDDSTGEHADIKCEKSE